MTIAFEGTTVLLRKDRIEWYLLTNDMPILDVILQEIY